MASPIFGALLIKKYIVQIRSTSDKPWREHEAHRSLAEAERVAAELKRRNPQAQVRIFNRITQQVVKPDKK